MSIQVQCKLALFFTAIQNPIQSIEYSFALLSLDFCTVIIISLLCLYFVLKGPLVLYRLSEAYPGYKSFGF